MVAPSMLSRPKKRIWHAALRMQQELRRYSVKLVADGSTPIQGRIGINTGEVVVRSIQTGAGQVEYTPIGHTTNLAARMQTAAPVGSIAASEATRKLCEGAISSSSRSARPKSKASANRSTFTRSPAWARYERGFSIQSAAA